MALSTIVGWAGSAVVQEVIKMGFSYVQDHMLPADNKAELERLKAALPQIKAVMSIAEALKVKHPDASQWVEQIRQAVEASEDVLDELEYKKLEDKVKDRDEAGGSASSSKKRKLSTINDDTLERLKKAVTMLDQAANGVENLLQVATLLGIYDLSESRQEASKVLSRGTSSFLTERKVFGREVEKEKIIGWLKQPTDARLSSFGIVGVGGLGKTTLAQFARQEMHGLNHFDETIWVCVSTNFNVEDITRKMLSELGVSSFSGKPLNALQETLKEKTHLKKLLIILDDLWDDEKMSDWEQLVAPLRFVQQGSKILFTTRMKSVVDLLERVIRTEHESLALQDLEEQELQLLFESYAFHGFNIYNHRDLREIGDQILKMLRGSPLAAKVIGSLLNSRMDKQYWRRVLNQGSLFNLKQANNVVEVLKLSYYHLPANLQQQSSQEERSEDIGEDYFNLLLRKSFFECAESWDGKMRYVMHDLVHELAQNVSHGECSRIERNDKSITIPSTVRHVYVHECVMEKVSHLENLRSLVVTTNSDSFVLPNNLIKKSLRLLKICGSKNSEMPKEISCLEHLRYLSAKGLPSVYKLYHLQVLEILGGNSAMETTGVTNLLRLRYMRLPKEIMQTIHGVHNLTPHLTSLNIMDCPNLTEFPILLPLSLTEFRINCVGLSALPDYYQSPNSSSGPSTSLLKIVKIKNCKNLRSLNGFLQQDNIDFQSIKEIEVDSCENLVHLPMGAFGKFESLHKLTIRDCPMLMAIDKQSTLLPKVLEYLSIKNCGKVDEPLLELASSLPTLTDLWIQDCANISRIPTSKIAFRSLNELGISGCKKLVEHFSREQAHGADRGSSLASLKINRLCIGDISLLLIEPLRSLSFVSHLEVTFCSWMEPLLEQWLLQNNSTLKWLTLFDVRNVKTLSTTMVKLTVLEKLTIFDANLLEELPELPTSLRELYISNAYSLKSLPATMARLTVLENLTIYGSYLLEELPELPASLKYKKIDGRGGRML